MGGYNLTGTTIEVPIKITCPPWCDVPPDEHVEMLHELDGACTHRSDDHYVDDPSGFGRPLEERRMCSPVRLYTAVDASPAGGQRDSVLVVINGTETTMAQALDLASKIYALADEVRASGGRVR